MNASNRVQQPGSQWAGHQGLVRVSSYSVASVLAVLMLSAVVPPLVADQSDRAVVNAPVALLTAPVAGDVDTISVKPGQEVGRGETIARISNSRVDRSTLITLEGKAAETRGKGLAAASKRESNTAYLAALDKSIQEQSSQLATIFRQQIVELQSRVAASVSSGQEKKSVLDRQATMVARNVASTEMLKPTEQQLAGALHQQDAQTAKLRQKVTQYEGLLKGVFVGDELVGLATLSQKRRDIEFDTQRLAIEQTELEASLRDQQNLLNAERERLLSMTAAAVETPMVGEILNVGAAEGRHVSAGDTLATLVDCDRTVVVSIFSYRQAQSLRVGSRVEISGGDLLPGQLGTVKEILPKAGDKVDDLYAIPFPQTERRELYVLVAPDEGPGGRRLLSADRAKGGTACNVGQWVTISRANGWVPSVSVVWRNLQDRLAGIISAPFTPGPANARSLPDAEPPQTGTL
ncbi:HlyD family efflux transporter periplasmic adaptor subunit [uncultured Enterovirga sp.]|uniref:HlyD family efflux transporter periplasmic adaptor subunit n=1 Tax=uncultured Enterovirga sp. TaxID=2026352 RepID=UPI0035CC72F1